MLAMGSKANKQPDTHKLTTPVYKPSFTLS